MSSTFLFVDDEPDLRSLLCLKYRKELATQRWFFLFALNGNQALDLLKTHPEILAVVTDVNMPDMDGYTLIENAKRLYPLLTFAILSAHTPIPAPATSIQFIPKPLDFKTLTVFLEKVSAAKDDFDKITQAGV